MKLNSAKTKTLTNSRSATPLPLHGDLLLCGSVLDVSQSLVVLCVNLYSKLTFEVHIREVLFSSSRALGIMIKVGKIFQGPHVLETFFRPYVLSRLEYCTHVWGSAASCYLRLSDGVVHRAAVLCMTTTLCELSHRRNVSFLCMLYKIFANGSHPFKSIPGEICPS
jgi:hypothetical protein